MFDAEDRQTIVQWAGVWLLTVTVVVSSLIMLAVALGIAFSAFRLAGGL